MNEATAFRIAYGEVVLITVASRERGIELAIARMFAKHGAKVAILDLDVNGDSFIRP